MLLPRDSLIGLAFCMVMVWSSLSASRIGWLMTEALSETRSAGAAIGPELVIFSLRMLLYLTESWRSYELSRGKAAVESTFKSALFISLCMSSALLLFRGPNKFALDCSFYASISSRS